MRRALPRRMRCLAWLVCPMLVAACGSSTPKPRAPTAPPATAKTTAKPEPPKQLGELRDAIAAVPTSGGDSDHEEVAASLDLLASVLRVDARDAAERIDADVKALRQSPVGARTHAELVKDALGAAVEALGSLVPQQPDGELQASLVAAQRSYAALDANAPLARQLTTVAATLRALANVVALHRGVARLFPVTEDSQIAVGYDAQRFRERVRQLDRHVKAVARERNWKPAGDEAARMLDTVGDVIEVAPLSLPAARWRTLAVAARFSALQLDREGEISLQRSDRIKAGLQAAVDALATVRGVDANPALEALVDAARDGVEAIDPGTAFVFQRGAIQEAMRATADAYLVAAWPAAPAQTASR